MRSARCAFALLFALASCTAAVDAEQGAPPKKNPPSQDGEGAPPADTKDTKAPEPPGPPPPGKKFVVLAAGGDVIPHGSVRAAAERYDARSVDGKTTNYGGYGALFARVRPAFAGVDIGFVNLETPIAPNNDHGTRSMVFNAPPDLLDALKDIGVNIVSFSNNHVYDQGRDAFFESLDNLDARGIPAVGAGRTEAEAFSPRVVESAGMKICFLAATRLLNVNRQPKTEAEPQIAFLPYAGGEAARKKFIEATTIAKKGCDFLLVSMHWGREYTISPALEDVALAHALLEAGGDGILGHHPHVLQPLKRYTTKDGRETFISFSMGNFISSQTKLYTTPPRESGWTRDSMVLRVTIERRDDVAEGPKGVLKDFGYYAAWTDRVSTPEEGGEKAPKIIRPVLIDKEVAEADAALRTFGEKGSLSQEDAAAKRLWSARREELKKRREEIAKVVGEAFLLPFSEADPL